MILAQRTSQRLGWPLRLALASLALVVLPASFRAIAAPPKALSVAQARPGGTVEQRLERLEKAVAALTTEIRALHNAELENTPPKVIKAIPDNGAKDVDPNLSEIRVTFSKDMQDGSWSWTQRSDETFPETNGEIHYLDDHRTCVLPVKLQPGKTYWLSINSPRFKNFKDTAGRPAIPYVISFKTRN